MRELHPAAPGSLYHYLGHYHTGEAWWHEPRNQEVIIRNGLRFHQWKFNRQLSVRKLDEGSRLPGSLNHDTFFKVLPCWPLRHYMPPADPNSLIVFPLREAAKSADYSWRAEPEMMRGKTCRTLVASDGSDSIWFEIGRGNVLVQRDFRNPVTRKLVQRIVVLKSQVVGNESSFPMEFSSTIFRDVDGKSVPTGSALFHVRDLRIDEQTSNTEYDLSLQPGTILNVDSGFIQITEGGEELLTEIANHLTEVESVERPARGVSIGVSILPLFVVCACGFLTCRWMLRLKRT